MILSHPVGDQVFNGYDGEMLPFGNVDQPHLAAIRFPIEQTASNHFKTQTKLGMYPSARQLSRPRWLYKAMPLKRCLKHILTRRDHIKVAGGDLASGIQFRGSAADENGREIPRPFHFAADLSESSQCGFELRPKTGHSAATRSFFGSSRGFRYEPV